jgi:electron transfer flavoprotein alpha subunit
LEAEQMSQGVLVVAESTPAGDGPPTIQPSTYELLGAARSILPALGGGPLRAVVAGAGVTTLSADLAAHGADRVYVADAPPLADYLAEAFVPVVGAAVEQADPRAVLLAHSANGRELGPRLAFRLGWAVVTDVVDLRVAPGGGLVLTKPVYGGSAVAEYEPEDPEAPQVATLRLRAFAPAPGPEAGQDGQDARDGRPPDVVPLAVPDDPAGQRARVVETRREEATGPRLKTAGTVVSGGRGLGGPENWHYVEELAAALGAAVGATRAVTDAGWVPSTHQVGLTGTTVTPDLYIALGISGAVQHIAGCSGARTIVAVNRDPEANIFKHARYGVVGDVHQVLPAFTERVKALRGSP